MENISIDMVLNDAGVIGGLDRIADALETAADASEDTQKALDKAFAANKKDVEGFNKAVTKSQTTLKKQAMAVAETARESGKYREALKGISNEIQVFGNGLGDIASGLKEKVKGLKETVKGLNSSATASKLFGRALKTIPLLAVIGLFGALVTFFTRTQKGADKLNKALAFLKGGFDFLIKVVGDFGGKIFEAFENPQQALKDFGSLLLSQVINRLKGLVNLLSATGKAVKSLATGDLEGLRKAGDNAANAVSNMVTGFDVDKVEEFGNSIADLAKGINDSAVAAAKLSTKIKDLENNERVLNVQRAAARAEIERLKKLSEDVTQTEEIRLNASRKAFGIEQNLLRQQTANRKQLLATFLDAGQSIDGVLQQLAAGGDVANDVISKLRIDKQNTEGFQEFTDIVAEFFELQEESFGKQTELQNSLNAIQQENINKAAELTKAYEDVVKTIKEAADDAELETLSPIERIKKERDIAVAQLQNLFNTAKDLAAKTGKELDLTDEFNLLFDQLQKNYTDRLKELRPDTSDIPELLPKREFEVEAQATGQRVGEIAAENIKDGVDNKLPLLESIKGKILAAFGFDDEQAAAVGAAFQIGFNNLIEGLNATAQAQIDNQNRIIESINQRVDDTESALDRELELKKAGLANNFDAEKAAFDTLLKEREAAEAKALQLKEKAAKEQRAIETASQVQSLVTATANILQGFSGLPFLGQALSIAAIAVMFGTFAKAKVDAAKAVKSAKLRKGGQPSDYFSGELVGASHEGGGIPAIARGHSLELEGREHVINVQDATEQRGLLERINNGEFRGFNLQNVIDDIANSPIRQKTNSITKTRANIEQLELKKEMHNLGKVVKIELEKQTEKLLKGLEEREIIKPLDGHVSEKKVGNTTVRKIVRFEK